MIQIKLSGVKKSFNGQVVLNGIDLEVSSGEFVVIVGPNGSGKSTLLKIMIGLLLPDAGDVNVLGFDVKKAWKKLAKHIGVVLANERSLYWKLTAWENLDIFGGIYGVPRKERRKRAVQLLELFGLYEHKDKPVEDYSTGMRKKLLLCKALIHNPKVLFIDELLNGLDAKTVSEVNSFLYELSEKGTTIVMVSHILHELNDSVKIVLLKNGNVELIAKYKDVFSKEKVYQRLSELLSESSEDRE